MSMLVPRHQSQPMWGQLQTPWSQALPGGSLRSPQGRTMMPMQQYSQGPLPSRAPVALQAPVGQTSSAPSSPSGQSQPANEIEAWLSVSAQEERHHRLGLSKPKAAAFIQRCELVSLGSYCAVSRALQCVGLKQFTYPFDWVRCPVEGVMQLFENKFEDFLTYSESFEQAGEKVFGKSKWGGSFWHHDPSDAKTQSDMMRRIQRLFGEADVSASKTRLFVRAANSSEELRECVKLQETLQSALPLAKVYLLVIMDLQKATGPMGISGNNSLICWRVHESVCPAGGNWTMQRQAEAYADALAFVVRLLAGEPDLAASVRMVRNLDALCQTCDDFDGADPAMELWLPKRVQDSLSQSSSSAVSNHKENVDPEQSAAPQKAEDRPVSVAAEPLKDFPIAAQTPKAESAQQSEELTIVAQKPKAESALPSEELPIAPLTPKAESPQQLVSPETPEKKLTRPEVAVQSPQKASAGASAKDIQVPHTPRKAPAAKVLPKSPIAAKVLVQTPTPLQMAPTAIPWRPHIGGPVPMCSMPPQMLAPHQHMRPPTFLPSSFSMQAQVAH